MRLVTTAALCGLLAFAGTPTIQADWPAPRSVGRAAHDLEEHAERLHETLHRLRDPSRLSRAAHRFEEEAERFHRAADRGGPRHAARDFERLRDEFRDLSRDYRAAHAVHHHPVVAREWHRLERAFRDLALEMGARPWAPHTPYRR